MACLCTYPSDVSSEGLKRGVKSLLKGNGGRAGRPGRLLDACRHGRRRPWTMGLLEADGCRTGVVLIGVTIPVSNMLTTLPRQHPVQPQRSPNSCRRCISPRGRGRVCVCAPCLRELRVSVDSRRAPWTGHDRPRRAGWDK
jgi:hypothetical protein